MNVNCNLYMTKIRLQFNSGSFWSESLELAEYENGLSTGAAKVLIEREMEEAYRSM